MLGKIYACVCVYQYIKKYVQNYKKKIIYLG